MQQSADYLTFGQWRYLRTIGQLQPLSAAAEPEVLTLEPRLHKLLNFFLDHKDLVVSREQILSAVWGEGAGSDESLTRAVAALRRALHDSRTEPTYIATLSKKGYCWLAPVAQLDSAALLSSAPAQHIAVVELSASQQAAEQWHQVKQNKLKRIRYIWFSTLALLLLSLSFALLFNKMNARASLPRYLQVTPVSALDGREQSPLLSSDESLLLFQYQFPDGAGWHWVVQQLPSMQSQRDEQAFTQLSQPHWFDTEQIIFRAEQQQECAFWRQKVKNGFSAAVQLFSCHQFIAAGQAMTADGLYWLDVDPVKGQTQLWLWQENSQQKNMVMQFPAQWRGINHLIVQGKKAYALAQTAYRYSALLELDLIDADWRVITEFDFLANQLSWWGEHDLLVNKSAQQLQVLSLRTGNSRVFGEMTFNLAESTVWQNSLLAVYPAQAVTDIRQLHWQEDSLQLVALPFVDSNRSESLLQQHQGNYYFVSDRSGLPQIWRFEGQHVQQISQFKTHQTIQQLFWFDNKMLLLIGSQLFEFLETTAELRPFTEKLAGADRFIVCNNSLYWTSVDQGGWALNRLEQGKSQMLLRDVVNVQCGPGQSLVLQQQDSPVIELWQQGTISTLPLQINWRSSTAFGWTSTEVGLYWLSAGGKVLNYFDWESQQQQSWPLSEAAQALVAAEDGTLFVEQFRAQDTDIVWLHPEPAE